jgi:PEP-CTERM motif-containing protein
MENRKWRIFVLLVSVLVLSYGVCSATLQESETSAQSGMNDTQETADPIERGPVVWADAGVMHLADGGGDVDFFSIPLEEGEILMAATTPLTELFTVPDTILGLFDDQGTLLVSNDDAGNDDESLGSKIEYLVTESDTFYIGVTGYDDFDFDGLADYPDNSIPHTEVGAYGLTVSIFVPEPATLALLALGSMVLFRRKRFSR